MQSTIITGLLAVLSCLTFLTEYAAARPAPEVGARALGSRISAGGIHTCAIEEDGTVSCWGANNFGQLGDGTTTNRLTAVKVFYYDAVAIEAGSYHTCVLRAEGTVYCWGNNVGGQLGNGTTTQQLTPIAVGGLSNAVAISAGGFHTCALLADGSVRCWGFNSGGQLGDGTTTTRLGPVVSGVSNAVAISAGSSHTCALRADGTVRCWGSNSSGQLGDGTTTNRSVPTGIGVSNAVAIGAGSLHTCALLADGTARCWGFNGGGQLGDGTTIGRLTPVPVSGMFNGVAILGGGYHTCALRADGTVGCWGDNLFGQLGDGTTTNRLTPVAVSSLFNAVAISVGPDHTCVFAADGTDSCWGRNSDGQLGVGTQIPSSSTPVKVFGLAGSISARGIAAGAYHACARRASGTEACWGANESGQLGNGGTSDSAVPARVGHPMGVQFPGFVNFGRFYYAATDVTVNLAAIANGEAHSCALYAYGAVRCWGANNVGQLGDGVTSGAYRLEPGPLVSGPDNNNVIGLAAGWQHSCMLRVNGGVYCWGANDKGQLGDGTTTTRGLPTVVFGLTNAVMIATGLKNSCAVVASGKVFCWGANNRGQLGNGTVTTLSSIPVQVFGIDDAVSVAVGFEHACAVHSSGLVRCWGENGFSQLGDGTITLRSTPVQVAGVTAAIAVGVGSAHGCALFANGGLRCWGANLTGQLGDGTTTSRSTPVAVSALSSVVAVAAGSSYTCALAVYGQPFCWGANYFGQLGNGTTTSGSLPTGLASFTFNVHPAVRIKPNGKKAQVIALANCDAGAKARIDVELRQGRTVANGQVTVDCAGALQGYLVKVNAHGKDRFVAGAAEAKADALVRDHGQAIDTQEWTRGVTISVGNFIKLDEHDDDD